MIFCSVPSAPGRRACLPISMAVVASDSGGWMVEVGGMVVEGVGGMVVEGVDGMVVEGVVEVVIGTSVTCTRTEFLTEFLPSVALNSRVSSPIQSRGGSRVTEGER